MPSRPTLRLLAAILAALALPATAGQTAEPLAPPQGEVVLTITGAVTNGNGVDGEGRGAALFDRAMLEDLSRHDISTSTNFLEGINTWSGPLASDVLEAAGVEGTIAIATALDGYVSEIPIADMARHDAILALELNGSPLPEEFAPLWIAWPRDQVPGLQPDAMDHYWVWSLVALDVR